MGKILDWLFPPRQRRKDDLTNAYFRICEKGYLYSSDTSAGLAWEVIYYDGYCLGKEALFRSPKGTFFIIRFYGGPPRFVRTLNVQQAKDWYFSYPNKTLSFEEAFPGENLGLG